MHDNVWPADIGQDPRNAPNPFSKSHQTALQSSLLSKLPNKGSATIDTARIKINSSEVMDKHIEELLVKRRSAIKASQPVAAKPVKKPQAEEEEKKAELPAATLSEAAKDVKPIEKLEVKEEEDEKKLVKPVPAAVEEKPIVQIQP